MADETFTCEICKGTFVKGWADADRDREYREKFPEDQGEPKSEVCDECYQTVMRWLAAKEGRTR